MKRCSKCKKLKLEIEFNKDKRTKDGLDYKCKQCVKDKSLNYKLKNKIKNSNINFNGTKICMTCNKELPKLEFNIKRTTKDGLQYNCKDCFEKEQIIRRKKLKNRNISALDLSGKKICCSCKKEYDKINFWKDLSVSDGLDYKCKYCASKDAWILKLKKYNLTQELYNKLLNKQENKCPICKKTFSSNLKPVIDHCHESGKVRGLLCSNCNTALGLLFEKEYNFLEAISYLNKNREN